MSAKITYVFVVVVCLLSSFTAIAQEVVAPLPIITNQNLNFRAGPSTDWQVYSVIPPNTPMFATARTSNSDWLYAEYQEQMGWVAAWLVIWEGGTDALNVLPIIDVAPPPKPFEPPFVTTQDFSALREGPGTDFARVGRVPPDVTLRPIGRTQNYGWWQVEYEGQRDWIAHWLLVWTGDIETLPIDGVDPVPFIRIARLPSISLVEMDRFSAFRRRMYREIATGSQALELAAAAWNQLNTAGMAECVVIETVGFRTIPEALLQNEVIYQPLLRATQNAFADTNAVVELLQDACNRTDVFITRRQITQALNQIAVARRNYVLASALVFGLE